MKVGLWKEERGRGGSLQEAGLGYVWRGPERPARPVRPRAAKVKEKIIYVVSLFVVLSVRRRVGRARGSSGRRARLPPRPHIQPGSPPRPAALRSPPSPPPTSIPPSQPPNLPHPAHQPPRRGPQEVAAAEGRGIPMACGGIVARAPTLTSGRRRWRPCPPQRRGSHRRRTPRPRSPPRTQSSRPPAARPAPPRGSPR